MPGAAALSALRAGKPRDARRMGRNNASRPQAALETVRSTCLKYGTLYSALATGQPSKEVAQ